MHKKTIKIVSAVTLLVLAVLSSSCDKTESAAEKRRKERQTINDYINANNINIIHGTPADDTNFGEKDYYLTPSGLYIHIVNKGEGESPQTGEKIIVRFYEISMGGDTIIRAMNASEKHYTSNGNRAYEFQYNENIEASVSAPFINVRTNAKAFNEAVSYMKEEGEAYLIVPSGLAFDQEIEYTAFRYHIKTKIKY